MRIKNKIYRKKRTAIKNFKKIDFEIDNLMNCKNPPDFQKNTFFFWYKNHFTLLLKNKSWNIKKILIPFSEKYFLKLLWINEILLNRFLYREKIFSIITKIKCFKW